jgi:hypothetical protein
VQPHYLRWVGLSRKLVYFSMERLKMLRRTRFSEPSYLNAGSSLSLVRCWLQTVGLLAWRSVAWRDRIDTMAISTGCRGDPVPLKRRLYTRVDIVKSFDHVIRTTTYCRMRTVADHGGMTVWCGESAPPLQSVKLFE